MHVQGTTAKREQKPQICCSFLLANSCFVAINGVSCVNSTSDRSASSSKEV